MGFPSTSKQRNVFSVSGPKHLTCIDWENEHHRMSVTACLVKGVYVLKEDTEQAHPWWEFFNFKLIKQLSDDDKDSSIFGAIFEYIPQPSDLINHRPHYVIAFRGTKNFRDLRLDNKIRCNKLHSTPRFHIAMEAVEDYGESKVWLTGHSLGAAIAMLVGRTMAKKRSIFLKSFLFNPPFVSIPFGITKSRKVQLGMRFARSIIIGGSALVVKSKKNISPFDTALSAWEPCLFVNPNDFLCCGYVDYFEHRRKMEQIGVGKMDKLAAQHSGRCLINRVIRGREDEETAEPFYRIPSANLTVNNQTSSESFEEAHSLDQWWKTDYQKLESTFYHWGTS